MTSQILLQVAGSELTEISWLNPIPAWIWFLAIVPAVVAFAVFIYRRERPLASEQRPATGGVQAGYAILIALRVLAILLIAALLAQPVLRRTKYQDVDSSVILLVDDSLSMDIADKYANRELLQKIADFLRSSPDTIESTKRYDIVSRLLRDSDTGLLEKLREKARVSVYSFGAGIRREIEIPRRRDGDAPLSDAMRDILPDYAQVRGEERVRETRISDALLEVVSSERTRGPSGLTGSDQRVSGILLFSDGQQTPGARPIEDVARRLGQQRIAVFAVGVGNPDEPKDIRIVSLDVSDVVLAGDMVPFDVSIAADGFPGENVRVELKFDGAIVASKDIVLEGQGRQQPVRLEFRPSKPGELTASVEVEKRPGELFVENNVVSKVIRVLDEKIRVLYAEGLPRWEYRFLMHALTRDTTMHSQIFLFSADANFVQESSPGVPPLREFPRKREELFAFHVVILGDVDAAKLGTERIALLKEFVYEAGGGLIFIAGETANPWSYLHTELSGVIPIEINERSGITGGGVTPKTAPFNVELTQAGREHTLMRLDNDPERNLKLWENRDGRPLDHLPGFLSFQETGMAKKGAVVLARHPSRVNPMDQKGLVVFAYMNYGKGRTFLSAVDDTWRWRAGVDNQYLYRFWGQVIRFLSTGRLLGKTPRYSITTDKLSYSVGETIEVEARIFDANMKPSTERTLTAYHAAQAEDVKGHEQVELELDPIQGQGFYRGSLIANRLGGHDVWIGSETERFAFRSFEVTVPALELKDPRRNTAFLEDIARLTGGAYLEIHDISRAVDKLGGETRSRLGEVSDDPLWDDAWLVGAFTAILALEWILRKLMNLL